MVDPVQLHGIGAALTLKVSLGRYYRGVPNLKILVLTVSQNPLVCTLVFLLLRSHLHDMTWHVALDGCFAEGFWAVHLYASLDGRLWCIQRSEIEVISLLDKPRSLVAQA